MFEVLLKIAPLTASAFSWLLSRNKEDRETFALLCERISEIMESFASASDDQRRSRNLCAELRVYVPDLEKLAATKGKLGNEHIEQMAAALGGVCNAWAKHTENLEKKPHTGNSGLGEVQDAAGHFRGLANLVRSM